MTSDSPQIIHTGITNNWTRVRPSFFRGLARSLEFAEDKCFGLILNLTVGHNAPWAKISPARFCDMAGVTRRRYEQAISTLLGEEDEQATERAQKIDRTAAPVYRDGIVRRRPASSGTGYEYSIAARPTLEQAGKAKCHSCGQVADFEFDLQFIPVPHSFFLNLQRSCDHLQYLLMKSVTVRTMRWDKAGKQIVVIPAEITIRDFESDTGKKHSEIEEDLKILEGFGFIGSKPCGRSRIYWARPENFASGPLRVKREVKQPKDRRKKEETGKQQNPTQPSEPKRTIRPVEFVVSPCGVCSKCGCYGPADIVEIEPETPKKPAGKARGAPKDQVWSTIPSFSIDQWKTGG